MGSARNPPTQWTTNSACSRCSSCPHWPHRHRMCVIAKRLGCLHWLARAAGHGHFKGASTSGRTFDAVHHRKPRYKKLAIVSPETPFSCVSFTTRVFRSAGRILHSGVTKINSQIIFHVIAVVLSTTVISAAMVWPLRQRTYSRNSDIAKGTRLSSLARTCSRALSFLRRLHVWTHHCPSIETVHIRKPNVWA